MFKKVAISIMSLLLLVSATSCSSNDKKDSKSSDDSKSSSSVSVADFKKEYNKVCDSMDEDLSNALGNLDFETVTADEFDAAYKKTIDEYDRMSNDFNDIEVPANLKDDWGKYLDLADEQKSLLEELKDKSLSLIELRDQLAEATMADDIAAATSLQDQIDTINDEISSIVDDGGKKESMQEDLRKSLDLKKCSNN